MQKSRIPSLDGLRAFSIALVFLGHLLGTRHFPLHSLYFAMYYPEAGVRVFFVISGFLITTLLMREREKTGTIHLKEFYVRRTIRIFPAAYFFIMMASLVFHAMVSWKDVLVAFTYMTSYSLRGPWIFGHLWSLSVEEQFYLLWPFAMACGTVVARRIAIGTVVLAPVLRFALVAAGIMQGTRSFFPLVADAIAMGCLLALFQLRLKKYESFFRWRGFPIIWILTFCVPIFGLWHARRYVVIGLPLLHFGLALCIQNAIAVRYRILNMPFIVWIGTLSYSLYLWQEPFLYPHSPAWYTAFPLNIGLAFSAALISYYLIERPALRLRGPTEREIRVCRGVMAEKSRPPITHA